MYSKLSEEEDNKMVERWQKEAEGILIFVSHHGFDPHPFFFFFTRLASKLELCRPVYSLPSSLRYLL